MCRGPPQHRVVKPREALSWERDDLTGRPVFDP